MLKFYLSDSSDEHRLRSLMRQTPMKGAYEVVFECEPNYFSALQVQGDSADTIAMKDTLTGELAGMGTRAVRRCYVNGRPQLVGYLSGLRCKPNYRSGFGLIRGYRLLKQVHDGQDVKLYLSTIIEDNLNVRSVLEAGRCRMPAYHDIGRFCTFTASLTQRIKCRSKKGVVIRHAEPEDIPELVRFLNREGSRRQFYPQYVEEDFHFEKGVLFGLNLRDIFLAAGTEGLLGIAAAWDQRGFRQIKIKSYRPVIGAFRPMINAGLSLYGYPTLPKPDTAMDSFSLGLICIKDDDRDIFASLLNAIAERYENSFSCMTAGLHQCDPLSDVLRRYKSIPYYSRVYVVCWGDGEADFSRLDTRVPYLELGAL